MKTGISVDSFASFSFYALYEKCGRDCNLTLQSILKAVNKVSHSILMIPKKPTGSKPETPPIQSHKLPSQISNHTSILSSVLTEERRVPEDLRRQESHSNSISPETIRATAALVNSPTTTVQAVRRTPVGTTAVISAPPHTKHGFLQRNKVCKYL